MRQLARDEAATLTSQFAMSKCGSSGQYHISGILIEDIEIILADLLHFVAAQRYLVEGIKQLKETQLLIATTRYPKTIEEDILRNFDTIIPFYYPDEKSRRDILRLHTEVRRHVNLVDDVNLDDIAKQTSWFSGADLENIILYASNISQEEKVNKESIDKAIRFISDGISISQRIAEMQEIVDFALRHCTINSVKEELLKHAASLNIIKTKPGSARSILDFHKLLELKPNFFGPGINVNEIIEMLKNRYPHKK